MQHKLLLHMFGCSRSIRPHAAPTLGRLMPPHTCCAGCQLQGNVVCNAHASCQAAGNIRHSNTTPAQCPSTILCLHKVTLSNTAWLTLLAAYFNISNLTQHTAHTTQHRLPQHAGQHSSACTVWWSSQLWLCQASAVRSYTQTTMHTHDATRAARSATALVLPTSSAANSSSCPGQQGKPLSEQHAQYHCRDTIKGKP